ncbi:MAG: type I glutamate--ammonia ligase [Candidatus Cloacimonetes bacterium]|nr:type I glutamate--ammonia ligase [Candidatus Cloacimonadota bacterium]
MSKSGKRRTRVDDEAPSRRELVPAHKVRPASGGAERTTGATRDDLLEMLRSRNVRFLRLQFIDIMGVLKNVEVPASQFEKALDGDIMFDGSSIQGFVRVEESDMMLRPDYSTFVILPWGDPDNRVARVICDVYTADGKPFEGDPRFILKRHIQEARALGYEMMAGVEAEFFLFQRAEDGSVKRTTHDAGGYFDLTPIDLGEVARRDIINVLEMMGFEVEAGHHEVAPGQHEIDFKYADALTTADDLATFKFVVRNIALQHGLHATFMPKPIFGQSGSGMHTHQSLFRDGENAFHDPNAPGEMSDVMRWYVAGLLRHARAFCAVTNPLVNSYKRLVSGYEAPVNVAWSHQNRSPMVRVPARRGKGTRLEVRMPDPSANPYLALAVQLAAGLDGVRNRLEPPEPVDKNIWRLSVRDRRRYRIQELPRDLGEALDLLRKSSFMRATLGEHAFQHFVTAKNQEWREYLVQVHDWEIEQYLAVY